LLRIHPDLLPQESLFDHQFVGLLSDEQAKLHQHGCRHSRLDASSGQLQPELDQKIQKECILVTSMFKLKFEEFSKYIEKFTKEQQTKINAIIAYEEIYTDINEEIYKGELKKWIEVLSLKSGEEELKLKC
jgi:two-component sensor histidine kinase